MSLALYLASGHTSYRPLNNLYKCTQLDKQTLSWFTANVLFLAYWRDSVLSLQKYLAGSASGLRNPYKTYEKALRTIMATCFTICNHEISILHVQASITA